MRNSIIIILLLVSDFCSAQSVKILDLPDGQPAIDRNDSTSWYARVEQLRVSLSLPDMQQAKDSFCFRLWTSRQVIDMRSADGKSFEGTVTSFAIKQHPKNPYNVSNTVSKQVVLTSDITNNIFTFIDTAAIIDIPTDSKIKGWSQGFDGWTIVIETADPRHYSFKTYWTPPVFKDSLAEARKIQGLVDYIFVNQQLNKHYQKLKLPPGKYHHDGIPGIFIPGSFAPPARTLTDLL